MKFNRTEIGGRETGAAAIRPVGTTSLEDAFAYANIGRKILGDFKQRLQQGGLKDGRFEQELQDGTVITVITNMIGLVPIDQIYVDTGNRKRKTYVKRCLGYIVQCIAATQPTTTRYLVRVTLPSGGELNSKSITGMYFAEADLVATDFPDNGAKYLNYASWDGSEYTIPSDYQLVSTLISDDSLTYEKLGPITYSKGAATGAYLPMTGLNPGWSVVTAYTVDSGTCGIDADNGNPVGWSFESIPCTNTLHVLADFQHKADEIYDGGSFTGSTLHYSGSYTQDVLPLFPDGCLMDYSSPYDPGAPPAYSPGTYSEKVNDWTSRSGDIYVALMNEASAYAYAYELAFYNDLVERVYKTDFASIPTWGNKLDMILRRKDSKGFITPSGFDFRSYNDIALKARNDSYGQTSVFMLPFDDSLRFSYPTAISDALPGLEFHQDTNFKAGGSGATTDGTADYNCGVHNMGTTTASGTYNIVEHWDITKEVSGDFGIPITVEAGIHTVGVAGASGEVRVWAYVVSETGESGLFKIGKEFTQVDTTPNDDTPDVTIRIKVGEFEDIAELVNFEQM